MTQRKIMKNMARNGLKRQQVPRINKKDGIKTITAKTRKQHTRHVSINTSIFSRNWHSFYIAYAKYLAKIGPTGRLTERR